ncbi:hypothetical protein [Nostoc parmelioides]|uniref:Uncharacterized protein n=1 Tax=Nostoc parmelioides FACHB-3921 TaxID=2692909 RepID=A0ABR8BLT8_9NOSO|nr:hypothetical protein [Nostoc parmelioides]MBD2254629.1 hypothetical protein [Nostoc parmelioides FACHB-3921]
MSHFTYTQQAPSSLNRNTFTAASLSDEQALAQAELYKHLEDQAQAVAPEEITCVEISFYDHEIYANGQLIAKITYDHNDFVTQPWLVMVNGTEEFRANTWAKCHRYICIHHKDGSLPVQEPEVPATNTGNEIMAQVFNECEKFGLELLDDGVYHHDEKLGEVAQTNGNWWFTRAADANPQRIFCNSALDAVWGLLNQPLEQMPSVELKHLLDSAELAAA